MSWVNTKQLLFALIITLLLLLVYQVISAMDFSQPELKPLPAFLSSVDVPKPVNENNASLENLLVRYNILQPEEVKTSAAQAEDENQTAEVKPIDKTLRPNFMSFDNEHQIGLVGVFVDVQTFAVLQLVNFASGEISFKKLREGESIGSYSVENISSHSVLLKSSDSALNLSLFKAKKNS